MGDHVAPVSWLEHWNQTQPLRLYLYGITVPLLGVALVYGWMSAEQMNAWLAAAGAMFIGSTVAGELARRQVTSPATVHRLLDETARDSYAHGVQDAVHRTPDLLAVETAQMAAVRQHSCPHIENGRRCVLNVHGKETLHHYG
jgi:hypothetical protein